MAKRAFLRVFYIGLFVLAAGVCGASADVGIDIRSDGILLQDQDPVSYVAAIDDCRDLTTIAVEAGDTRQTVSPADTSRIAGSSSACELQFDGTGMSFQPLTSKEGL